jgi:L-histidine Nalpha-methyltransferase
VKVPVPQLNTNPAGRVEWSAGAVPRTAFAADARRGLAGRPFRIPSHYLYDALGSSLFEAICHLPWYPISRAEKGLLLRHAPAILASAARPLTIVELGCGTGEKLALLLDAWREPPERLTVTLVDVSAAALQQSARLIASRGAARVVCHQTLYEDGVARATADHAGGRLILFLGSNLGNFDPEAACRFLQRLRVSLAPQDLLLLGVDLVKPEADLLLAYDDPLGVTAAFNLNVLARMNRELGAGFDLRGFEHRAVWRPDASRVEMHLVSRRLQRVTVPEAGCSATFEAGDTLWTENSYKYTTAGIEAILRDAGLRLSEMWLHDEAQFALLLAHPHPEGGGSGIGAFCASVRSERVTCASR